MELNKTGLDGLSAEYDSTKTMTSLAYLAVTFLVVSSFVGYTQAEDFRTEAWTDAAHQMPAQLASLDSFSTSNSLNLFGTQPEASDTATASPDQPSNNPYATAGSWRWAIYTGGAFDIQRDGEQYNVHFAASYFFRDDLNISIEAGGLFFNQPSNSSDTGGFNFNLLMRWHFIRHDNWTMYGDAGAGFLIAGDEIPERGTSYDFTPQAGVGISYRINEHKDIWLLTGVRWHHISNANINGADQNPGRDSIMAYVGIDFPF